MTLAEKVQAAILLIAQFDDKPIVLSSFGKDSIVLLDLIKKSGKRYPILFFKEPFFPKKYEFANDVIHKEDYTVYDYPPLDNAITQRGYSFEIINYHQVSSNPVRTLYLPTGIVSPDLTKPYLCGLEDIFNKPKCSGFDFPWKTLFIGHKSSDVDPILGGVQLKVDSFVDGEITYVFPLRYFTDEDIWNYTIREDLRINEKRYNRNDNWKEFKDYTYNPDYFPACITCMNRDSGNTVFCPKLGKLIPNVAATLPFIEVDVSHYLTVKGE